MSWRARWQGVEHPCSPEPTPTGLRVRLRGTSAQLGWEEVAPGTWVRVVPVAELDALVHVTRVGRWRGEDWAVQDERAGELLLEHLGGSEPVARGLGAERVDRGVFRRWVPLEEVRSLRESQTLVSD